jgi:hypothetical protein
MEVPRNVYEAIAEEIASADSPVGIDAKKTHVIILHRLQQIAERLDRIETAMKVR